MNTFVKSIIVLAVAVSSTAHAQLLRGFGIKVGVTAANQTWDFASQPDPSTDNRWGITASAFVELLRMPYLSLLVEAQYAQKGMSWSGLVATAQNPDGTGQFITKRPRVDFLSIPILAKMRFGMPLVTPYLIAGPRYDLLLTRHGEGFQAVIDRFKSSELGATFGVGAELAAVLPFDVLIEFRYNASLQDAYDGNSLKVRNRTIDMMLGVRP
jgi:hypothetical protein